MKQSQIARWLNGARSPVPFLQSIRVLLWLCFLPLCNRVCVEQLVAQSLPVISVQDLSAPEPGPGAGSSLSEVTVTLSAPSAVPVQATISSMNGTAVAGADFYFSPSTVYFLPGVTNIKIPFAIYEDSSLEAEESFSLHLSNPQNAVLGKAVGVCHIRDYETGPRFSIASASFPEGHGSNQVSLTVFLTPATTTTVSVAYTTRPGTALEGEDFSPANGTLTFPPGVTNRSILLNIRGDLEEEPDESFSVALVNPVGGFIQNQWATVTLQNDDLATFSVWDTTAVEPTGSPGFAEFRISLSSASRTSASVTFFTKPGTARAPDDYQETSGVLTFSPGVTEQFVVVPLMDDFTYEGPETFFLCLTNGSRPIGSNATAVALILDDDFPVTVDAAQAGEGDTNLVFNVRLLQPFSETITLEFYTAGNTAYAEIDFIPVVGSIVFPPGVLSQTVEVPILNDEEVEPNEEFYLYVQPPIIPYLLPPVIGTIIDDEPRLAVANASVAEPVVGTNLLRFTVSLSKTSSMPISVEYSTLGVSANAGADFFPISGTLVFDPGQANKTVVVPVIGDEVKESLETLFLRLTNAQNAFIATDFALGHILDTSQLSLSSFQRPVEPLGPSSRMTDLVFSEIMYRPPTVFQGVPGPDLEFVELYNAGPFPCDIGGCYITGEISLRFTEGTILGPGDYLVLARDEGVFAATYGVSAYTYEGKLADGGGTLRLRNRAGAILLEVNYDNKPPWPALADGKGRSLVLARPSFGEGDPRAWDVSEMEGGSPGGAEPRPFSPLHSVTINELLANSVLPDFDFVELYNHSSYDLDISGCTLSDSPDTNKFVFVGAIIPAGSYLALDDISLGFKLKAEGDTVYFRGPDGQIIDSVRYGALPDGVSLGRFPEGGTQFYPLFPPTPFARNDSLLTGDVVINEIMYAPASGDLGEFVELHNTTTNTLDIGGWSFTEGIQFSFPTGTVISPKGHLVIAKDLNFLRSTSPTLNQLNSYGNFTGSLADDGERIVLARPILAVNDGVTNTLFITENEVDYRISARQNRWSRGGGSSLELRDPWSENRFASNWAPSDESGKSVWITIEATWTNQVSTRPPRLQMLLLGPGECLVDDVELIQSGQPTLVPNSSFETGLMGWEANGNHGRSGLALSGFGSSQRSLHLRAGGSGDPVGNHVGLPLPVPPGPGPITLRAKARWLSGHANLVIRLTDQNAEASATLPVPRDLGTPGRDNTRAQVNLGPVVSDVQVSPLLPAGGQPVVVTAQLADPDGLDQVRLRYRVDPSADVSEVPMLDSGEQGDRLARDGIYSAIIPGQSAGALVAFHVTASDGAGDVAATRFPGEGHASECLVRFGEQPLSGGIEGLRVWMTSSNLSLWNSRSRFSDEPLGCTVVYGNARVIYDAAISFAGSALERTNIVSATNSFCSYTLVFPSDEKLLGQAVWHLEPVNPVLDPSLLRGRALGWMAEQMNLPLGFERYLRLSINGVSENSRGIPVYTARQYPDLDFLERWFSEYPGGELFEVTRRLEPDTLSNAVVSVSQMTLADTALTQFPRRNGPYRWNWRKTPRQLDDDDYLHLFGLADALNAPPSTYENLTVGAMDVDQWIKMLAFRRGAGDRGSFGIGEANNAFLFKPTGQKWRLLAGALEAPLGAPGGIAPTNEVFPSSPVEMSRFINQPALARKYLRALQRTAQYALNSEGLRQGVLEPAASVLEAHGIASSADSRTSLLKWMDERKTYFTGLMPPSDLQVLPPYDLIISNHLFTISGTASPDVTDLASYYKGWELQVRWTGLTNWTAQVLLVDNSIGQDSICAQAENSDEFCSTQQVTLMDLTLPSTVPSRLGISEIHYAPLRPGGGFVEFYNAGNQTLNLGQLSLQEFGFSFPTPTLVPPGSFVLLVEDQSVFTEMYGNGLEVAGELPKPLNPNGGTLLLRWYEGPDLNKVKYGTTVPWRALTGTGRSLQVIDPSGDNARVSNWTDGMPTPGFGVFSSRPAYPLLWLNEVQTTNTGFVLDNMHEKDPWIEIFNSGTNTLVLGGSFFLTDNLSNLTKWPFPSGTTIAPGKFLLVWADGQPAQADSFNLHTSFRLSPQAGVLALVQAVPGGARIVDYLDIPALPPGRSFGAFPNGQLFDRELLGSATPGSPNRPPPIFINEWMASNKGLFRDPADNDSDDWMELYNPGAEPRNLRGYGLADQGDRNNPFIIPFDKIIAPHGHLLVWVDEELDQNQPDAADIHIPGGLSSAGDSLYLFAPDGTVLDVVQFGEQTNNISEGRFPDGGNNTRFMPLATPGASNRIVNFFAPALSSIPNRVITLGQTLRFPVVASDFDTPPSFLGFRLGPNAPAGAELQLTNFVWKPSAAQAPSTNLITIQVFDDGNPALTSSQTFQAIVSLPPRVSYTRGATGQNNILLSIATFPGNKYRLEYKNNLLDPVWQVFPEQTATATNMLFNLTIDPNAQRFFRVRILD